MDKQRKKRIRRKVKVVKVSKKLHLYEHVTRRNETRNTLSEECGGGKEKRKVKIEMER